MKICIVGAGSIGKRHLKNIATVCNNKSIPLSVHLYRSTNNPLNNDMALLVDKQIYDFSLLDDFYDAVIIANPTHLHFETIQKFQGKTKNFFIEKPVFENPNHKTDEFIKDSKVKYYIACPLRYLNVLSSAKEFIQSENIWSARAICSTYLPDWRPGQDYRELYCAHKEQGGGVKIDLIHEWDYIISLFGYPKNINMMCGKYSSLEIDSEDLAIYIANYEKFLLELHLDYFGKEPQRFLELYCESGVYRFDLINSRITCNGKIIKFFNEDSNDKYIKEMSFFIDMITEKVMSTNTLENSCNVMKIALSES